MKKCVWFEAYNELTDGGRLSVALFFFESYPILVFAFGRLLPVGKGSYGSIAVVRKWLRSTQAAPGFSR